MAVHLHLHHRQRIPFRLKSNPGRLLDCAKLVLCRPSQSTHPESIIDSLIKSRLNSELLGIHPFIHMQSTVIAVSTYFIKYYPSTADDSLRVVIDRQRSVVQVSDDDYFVVTL